MATINTVIEMRPTANERIALPATTLEWLMAPRQPCQGSALFLLEDADNAKLNGEEEEEHSHARGKERVGVEMPGVGGDIHKSKGRRPKGGLLAPGGQRSGGGGWPRAIAVVTESCRPAR